MITKYGKLLKLAKFNDDIAGPVASMYDYCVQNRYNNAQSKALMEKYIKAKNNGAPLVVGTFGPEIDGNRKYTAYITPKDFAHYVASKHFTKGDDLVQAAHIIFNGGTTPTGWSSRNSMQTVQTQSDMAKNYSRYIIKPYSKLPNSKSMLAIIDRDYSQKYFPKNKDGIDRLTTLYSKSNNSFKNGVASGRFLHDSNDITTDIFPYPSKIQYLTQQDLANL